MWMLLATAMGADAVELMVEGETLMVYHGDYCSYPTLAGITTKTVQNGAPKLDWDYTYAFDASKERFTGLINGDQGALPLDVVGDVARPESAEVRAVVASCAPHMVKRPALLELLRKSTPAHRSLVIRHLINKRIEERPCAVQERSALMEEALVCQAGKCEAFLDRLDKAGVRCK